MIDEQPRPSILGSRSCGTKRVPTSSSRAGSPPRIRVTASLRPVEGVPVLTGEQIDRSHGPSSTPSSCAIFEDQLDVDFSFSWGDRPASEAACSPSAARPPSRCGSSPPASRASKSSACRQAAEWMANLPRGFVLVTGPTGSGKSTTLASIIDRINETRSLHILTIEDPVEYVHNHKQSAVSPTRGGPRQPVVRPSPSLGPARGPRRPAHR